MRALIGYAAEASAAASASTLPAGDPRRREIALVATEGARFTSRFLTLLFDSLGSLPPFPPGDEGGTGEGS